MRGYLLGGLAAAFFVFGCDSPPEGVEVVRYQGPPITEESLQGEAWVARVDTVLRRVHLVMDASDDRNKEKISLQEDAGHLPVFLEYRFRPEPTYWETLVSGKLHVQHFDLNGEISGRFEGRLRNGLRFDHVVWADVSEGATNTLKGARD